MFSTLAVVVCIAFIAGQITTTQAACMVGWIQGAAAANQPCYLLVPGTTTHGQARVFCATLAANNANLGWPDSMQDLNLINARSGAVGIGTYWLGLVRSGAAWVTPANAIAAFTNWRPGQPDRCCGRNVSCIIAGYRRLPGGMWDDTGCDIMPRGLDGYLCKIG